MGGQLRWGEAVCFKKLEAEGKLVPKQPEARSQSPAGGRSQTPGPGPRLNKIVEVGRSSSCTRSTTATRGAFQSPGEQGELSSNQPPFAPANNLPAGQATSHTRSTTATQGAFQSLGKQGELSSNSPPLATANSIPAGQAWP